jgi:hypothetical protein
MTDEELSTYVAMFASGNADGAVRTLVSEIRRLRAENAELRDDARVGRAVRELEARAQDEYEEPHDIQLYRSATDGDWQVSYGPPSSDHWVQGPPCESFLEAVERAGRG